MSSANSLAGSLTLLALISSAGCAHQNVSNERARQVALTTQRVAQLEESVREGEAEIMRMREAMSAHATGHSAGIARIDEIDADLARIQDQLEAWQLELRQVRRHIDNSLRGDDRWRLHVDGRLEHIEGMLGVQSAPLSATPEPSKPAQAEAPADPASALPDDLPDDAAGQLAAALARSRADEHDVARAILEHGLQAHPEASEAPEMRYRLAETWFGQQRWSQAASAFQAVSEGHPDTDWAAWSLVRQGECFREMGDADTARIYFEDAVRLHPDTKAAKEAKKLSDGLL